LERYQAVFDKDVTLELALRTSWQQLGGTGFGAVQFGKTPDNYQLLARHHSRPLPQLVHQLNKESDNGLAQLLFQRLANPSNQANDLSLAQAEQQVLLWLSQNQINTKGMQLENGSGLSRTAQLSAEQLAAILVYNWRQAWAPEFISSLPLAGQDGTIRQRFQQSPVLNQARLKTGTLRNVTAIAGYVWDQQQRPYVFVAIVNANNASSAGRPLLNRWVTQLVQSQ
jgi:D-alanyl-D-alanine carboxypeptidase/D-alanyl-D-alanine-endopeptidase (penicillin-binding protein 4)